MNFAIACRLESLQSDMQELVDLLNSQKAQGLPALTNDVGWAQKGPLVKEKGSQDTKVEEDKDSEEPSETEVPNSRHFEKFRVCGESCFHHARTYYAKDFEVLGYPQLPSDM